MGYVQNKLGNLAVAGVDWWGYYNMERDEKGRFLPGHKPYKQGGRKEKVVEVAYLELLKEQVGEEEWAEIVTQVAKIAKGRGDEYWEKLKPADILRAFVVLADRFLGKPPVSVDVDLRTTEYVKELLGFD